VRSRNLDGKVFLAGYVEDVSLVYKASDILVHPSFYDNIPISIIEALSAGRPVIASRVGGIPEIIADGRNGTLFDAGSAGQLAESMLKMAATDYAALGRAASADVAEKFSAGKMKAKYIELMNELTGGA
jgi:glycosyltransferase involved in cell wall biosynthesis